MRLNRNSAALGAVALMLAGAGIPALAQKKPESLLPPGFDQPVAPAPTPAASPAPSSAQPGQTPPPTQASANPANPLNLSILPGGTPTLEPTPTPTPTATPTPGYTIPPQYELPAFARRSLARVGIAPANGIPANAYGDADGRYLETLMRRLNTPIASRWLEIGLRRTLAAQTDTPAGVNGADFAAERGWLLLRMGESVVARAVVQGVDTDNYTPKLLQVAMQASLATGDPAELCPLLAPADRFNLAQPGWVLAQAMCAGLAGEPQKADALIDQARHRGTAGGIDLLLAEKVLGSGSRGERAVTIEWTGVDQLDAWRYGLATATGVQIPADLLKTVGPQVRDWQALSPMLDAPARIDAAQGAAARGILSSAAMVDLYGEIDMGDNGDTAAGAIARDLRTAYVGSSQDARLDALRKLWDGPDDALGRYARLVLTARAAARIAPADKVEDVNRLIASMLTAGLDRAAMRWEDHVDRGTDAWAMLALADPAPRDMVPYGAIDSFKDNDASLNHLKTRMLVAGLAGLGRLSAGNAQRIAQAVDLRVGVENSWTRALTRAVEARQPGTVMLLAAVGMQTPDWDGVPPEALYRIVAALKAVGLEGEARMIAAEAIARA